jgi:hypothetical protein
VTSVPQGKSPHGSKPVYVKENITVDVPEGGTTIAAIYAGKDQFEGQTVTIKGKVTKFNRGILGKNWAHIQDGTESAGNFDLTITTLDEVKVGEIIIFEGKIALDKDFGSGYTYEVIMVDAKAKREVSL